MRKSKINSNFADIQMVRYMGNKRNILSHVISAIMKIHDPEKIFCDLMAGTHSISYAIKTLKNHQIGIISNDSQICSFIIGKALIENNTLSTIEIEDAKKDLNSNFYKNSLALKSKWKDEFIKKNQYRTHNKINLAQQFFHKEPYCLFTFYFANIFFSLNQCNEIDSFRYAIEKIDDPIKKNIYLACLIYAVSYGSSSFGHFAQPRKVTSEVRRIRKRSIYELFFRKLKNLKINLNNKLNKCFNKDYKELFLDRDFLSMVENIGTIYLDPPYSPANYSRFYHVLETLIKYDYPNNEYKGLYRHNRFLSTFCKKTKVIESFEEVINFSFGIKANLVISYSNTGLLTKKKIMNLCRKKYSTVWSEKDIHHIHSTQGNRKKNGVKELIIVAKY